MRLFITFISVLPPIISVAVHASPVPIIESRNPGDNSEQVIQDINGLTAGLGDLTQKVNDFDGGLLQSAGILLTSTSLSNKIDDTISTVSSSQPFSSDGSNKVTTALASTVGPITDSLYAIQYKYDAFNKVYQAGIVLNQVKSLKNQSNVLIERVSDKVAALYVPLVQAGGQTLNGVFDQTIQAYGGHP